MEVQMGEERVVHDRCGLSITDGNRFILCPQGVITDREEMTWLGLKPSAMNH